MSNILFVRIVDRESQSTTRNNGGDYDFGRTVAVRGREAVGVRYWTSADFAYCPNCGCFDTHSACPCPFTFADHADVKGWGEGRVITDPQTLKNLEWWWEHGGFAKFPWA